MPRGVRTRLHCFQEPLGDDRLETRERVADEDRVPIPEDGRMTAFRSLSRCSMFRALIAGGLVLGSVIAQDSEMSSTSIYGPGTTVRLGLAAAATSSNFAVIGISFTGCSTACSFQGVPLLIDLPTAVGIVPPRQWDTVPPVSERTRWRWDLQIPAGFPAGLPLRFQAVTIDTANALDVSKGIAAQVVPPGPPRDAFAVSLYPSGGWTWFYLESLDIDTGTTRVVHNGNVGGAGNLIGINAGHLVGLTRPQTSDDGRFIALSMPIAGNALPALVFVVDLATGGKTWLPLSGLTGLTWRHDAKFQPGFSDRIWTLESGDGACSTAGGIMTLVATGLASPPLVLTSQQVAGRCSPTTSTVFGWRFDWSGQYALVVTQDRWTLALTAEIWHTPGTTTPQAASITHVASLPIPSSSSSSGQPAQLVAIPYSSRIVVQYRDTSALQERFVVVDCATGVVSAPYTAPLSSGSAFVGVASANGEFVTFQHSSQPDTVHFLDGLANVTAGTPSILGSAGAPSPHTSGRGVASFTTPFVAAAPDVVVWGSALAPPVARPLFFLSLDANRAPRCEVLQAYTGAHDFYLAEHSDNRPWTGLGDINGLVAVGEHPIGSGSRHWMMVDTNTMTWASLGPSLNGLPSIVPAGTNPHFVFD